MDGSVKVKMLDWLNENAYRAFPFEDNSSGRCIDGTVMPNWLFLDAKAMLFSKKSSNAVEGEWVGVSGFEILKDQASDQAGVTVSFVISTGGTVLSMSHSFASTPGKVYRFDLAPAGMQNGMYVRISGFFGAPATFEGMDHSLFGAHQLSEPRKFLPTRCVIRPGGFGMDAVWADTSVDDFVGVNGVVHLRNGNNTSLRIVGNAVELSISESGGDGFECPEDDKCEGINFINGQRADTNGNFSIVGGQGVVVTSGEYNGIPAVIVKTNGVVDSYAKPR